MGMKMVRYGIIGIGNMGSAHAKALFNGEVKNSTLTCVCDCDKNRIDWARGQFGDKISYYADYREMLSSSNLDVCLIATPHYQHTKMAIDAFDRGLHVLTEKPAGVDTKSVELMDKKALESGKSFGIMFNQRTSNIFSALKSFVDLGILGDIKRFNWIISNWYRTQAYYESSGWRASWNGEGGGVLLNQAPHNLDIWQWIMGMPSSLTAFCHEGLFHDVDVEDDATIYAEYSNGATATFITSTGEYPGSNRLEISGTYGKAIAENGVLKLFLLKKDERKICFNSKESMPCEEVTEIVLNLKDERDGHILIMENFSDHILNGTKLIAPGEEGIKSLGISNAAYLSSWKRSVVDLPVDEDEFLFYLNRKKASEVSGKLAKKSKGAINDMGNYSRRWSVQW
ncbi:Predicted dehydrogenase [Butyrivibrio proteoclasticus]|uniref:Predicted dehydrogenase n=2 Tax=Butyrivibrio proteoclasticus TaxID=43305 RepID=A0A1I5XJA8_9FIRM|nr:Predicted dehydrogenase [Butyrivibrio proteoclasticus]